MNLIHAIILGIVEGVLEFLPVSAAGNLTLVGRLLSIPSSDFIKIYEIIMQLGAVIAVLILYAKRLLVDHETIKKIIVAFIPTGIIGLLVYKLVKNFLLYNDTITVFSLIVGGIIILLVEYKKIKPSTLNISNISYKQALAIGFIQTLAFIPGVSRSGATIVGAMLLGIERKAAVEFSFLLAIPTILAAGSYALLKDHSAITGPNLLPMAVSFLTALIFAIISVKTFLRFISSNNLKPFGFYRIIVGVLYSVFR
ncbi:Undecaprenyl-diphosphatase [Thermodesulfobium narugense DSM 14796]|uniref:Undecaprenyl-diphosphatase n=1 Tax=Thermodesulfobium narugense DSM 14796 TaxID=747365 RepID=M1E4S3_9BACT|nr:undecaprenyl-diphosphatase UppP [Thermodesulfobium narugense]AEE14477.1 Undecaprenyl-diphosphatase [Thermodesulfobium narugense DSM 14796]